MASRRRAGVGPLRHCSADATHSVDGIKVAAMSIPPFSLSEQLEHLGPGLEEAVLAVLRSGQYSGGSTIAGFEQAFAELCGGPHAIGCNSGTDALILALRALGIGPDDEVITSSFSFFATAEAISAVGAIPVFVDVAGGSYLIDAERIEAAITPATRALLPVHLFGRPVDMERINAIAAAHGELGYAPGSLPTTERLCAEVLSLPIFPELSADQQDTVIRTLQRLLSGAAGGAVDRQEPLSVGAL